MADTNDSLTIFDPAGDKFVIRLIPRGLPESFPAPVLGYFVAGFFSGQFKVVITRFHPKRQKRFPTFAVAT